MKIAFVTPRYPPHIGGIEKHVKEIAERLAKVHDVEVFTLDDTGLPTTEMENDVKINRFKPISLSEVMKVPPRRMVSELRHCKADIVHAHGIQNAMPYFARKGVNKSKFVITSHYGGTIGLFRKVLFKVYKPFLLQCLRQADRIICVSNFEKDAIVREFDIDYDKISLISNGVDKFAADDVKTSNNEFRIMFAGRLDFTSKNIDKLIKAFVDLHRQDAKLVIVGDGPDREKIIKMISDYGIQSKVELIINPTKKQLGDEYCKANLFVMPSVYECFGMAAAEALLSGVTTIVTNSTALSDFVTQQHAYGIEPPITSEKIAEAITRVANGNMEFKKYSGYSWDAVAENLESLYTDLLKKTDLEPI